MMRNISAFYICLFMMVSITLTAQDQLHALSETEQQQVIAGITDLLNEHYVFPEVAKEMTGLLSSNHVNEKYAGITVGDDFAKELTNDLQSVSKDKHLRVIYDPAKISEIKQAESRNDRETIIEQELKKMRASNFGFKEVKILDGNIGYINLTNFYHTDHSGETAISVMEQVKNTHALIIDLRENGGGSPSLIQLISSYFFDKPVHLNTFYFRPNDSYRESWTFAEVNGEKRPDIPIFVLTSKFTYSAAEEFSYNLQNLKRATIIGEVTGGAAHPGGSRIVTDRFLLWLPTGRAINPITKTNWEGTGVIPDIEVTSDKALDMALQVARG